MILQKMLSQNNIINCFCKSGISISLDGSQDDEFKSFSINDDNEVLVEIVDDNNISEKENL